LRDDPGFAIGSAVGFDPLPSGGLQRPHSGPAPHRHRILPPHLPSRACPLRRPSPPRHGEPETSTSRTRRSRSGLSPCTRVGGSWKSKTQRAPGRRKPRPRYGSSSALIRSQGPPLWQGFPSGSRPWEHREPRALCLRKSTASRSPNSQSQANSAFSERLLTPGVGGARGAEAVYARADSAGTARVGYVAVLTGLERIRDLFLQAGIPLVPYRAFQ
jgi:hypothetical protein